MVRHRQPRSLYSLCHKWFSEYLGDRVVNAGYDSASNNQTLSAVRLKLRPYFVEHIPIVVRSTLLEETGEFLLQKSMLAGVDCDYGRSVLYLLYLLLTKEIRRLKVTLCCYYGCRDMEGVLRCIKKNGGSLEHLELSRTSLLRMDPLLFRNVLTSASRLTSLVVKNICSDAMLKLIGSHCCSLQYLDISSSKQVSDMGIESLCCQVQIRDKRDLSCDGNLHEIPFRMFETASSNMVQVQEDFGDGSSPTVGCGSGIVTWRSFRKKVRSCLRSGERNLTGEECLVEIKQVLHPVCFTLLAFDITDTSVTNAGLIIILKKIANLHTLGEYSVSDNFLRSLFVVSSMKSDRFGLLSAHTRKVSNAGMYNLVHVMPCLKALTCWEPLFDITDLSYLNKLKQLTLLRLPYNEMVLQQILRYVDNAKAAIKLEKICLEFILQDDYPNYQRAPDLMEFDLSRIFNRCDNLKVFTVEFKDSLMLTPPVGYGNNYNYSDILVSLHCLSSLVHVQFGQIVQSSAVAVVMMNCSNLEHLHCNNCPDLDDHDLGVLSLKAACSKLKCFYIYEAPLLTFTAFQTLIECFPELARFGNLTRWAVNCEGIQQVVRTIRDNNYDIQILCGSHWFASNCAQAVTLSNATE